MMIKTGVLVFGMILLVLLAPFVASFTDSNFAMRSGSFGSGSYLGSQGIGLYGQSSQEICSSGQDFVVQVAPFGCTPTVVRSDLLEEQNVAVFCPLIATQLNPLIEIDRIDSVSFSGQERSPGISGIGFHPTRAALGFSSSSPIGSPVANDIGYAVIVLKQEKSEANMPDFVNGTLVANLRYKMRDIGVGSVTYYIPEMDSSEWENSFNQYGFWGDKGYIKVDGVGENSATISVYSGGDAKNKLRSFTLTKGKSSNEFYVPGFFCQAGAVLRLDDLVNPDTRARLSVSGEIVEIKKGETFLDNKCRIMDLASQGLLQNIDVRCEGDDGVVNFELSRSPSVKIKVDGEEYNVGVGHRIVSKDGTGIYLGDVRYSGQSEDQSNLQVSIFPSSSSLLELPTITASMKSSFKTIEAEKMSEQFGYEFELIGFSDGVNSDFSTFDSGEEFEEYFSGAMGDYDDVVDNFGSEVVGILGDADYTYGRQALVEAIKLADSVNQNEEAVKLCNEFSEIYSGESLGLCAERGVFANLGTSVYGVNVNGHFKEISFLDISEPSFREYGVVLSVGAESVSLTKGERKTIKSGEYVQLVSLDENSVKLNVGLKPSDESKDFIEKSVTLKEGESQTYGSNYNFGIADINIEKVAKISLSPNIKVDGTSSNFSFQIGIEKRAIQLTPEKTESRINTLNETIEKWTELSDNLEGIVKGFNAACIATQTVLTVKNLFTGMGGTAIARQDVNAYWKGVCKDYEALEFNSIDDCLVKNSDKIEASIKARANEIKSFNEEGINDDNRDDRLEDIASGLINQRFADPNDPGKNITIDKNFTDALLKTDSEGYLMSDREMRDIDMELSILASNPNDPIARDKFDKLMGNFYVRSGLEVGARTAADSYGINPKFVTVSAEGVKEDIAVDEFLLREGITDRPKEMTEKFARIYIDASTDTEYLVGHSADGVVKETYKRVDGAWVKDTEDTNPRGLKFTKYDSSSYKNKYKSPELTFFETSPYKGFPALVPIDSKNGWYAAVKQKTGTRGSIASYDDSGAVSSFSLCNVGKNGREEFNSGLGDDECRVFNPGTGSIYGTFPGLTKAETDSLVRCAMAGVEQAEDAYKSGVTSVSIRSCSGGSESFKVGNPAVNLPNVMCQDFMSAKDCKILFNVCDPVVCPSSRCDFGGTYAVDNVVQSGIIGSIALCLPNIKEGIVVPVCLTGVKAGIDGLVSVFTNYRDCLEHNLETGEMVGVCDEIHSIYLCEFFWKQAVPLMNMGIPRVLAAFAGESGHGGGEYATAQAAWDNMNSGLAYMTNQYGANVFSAFGSQSTEEVGSSFCKSFASVNYPNSGGGFLDALLEPESPPQFHAWFNEVPFSTATVPATSQYKVFYHIFAGKNKGAYYNVYLSNPTGGSYFQSTGRLVVASGYIGRGDYASQTKDLTAPKGYSELCISVNGNDECGFKQVSTSFAVNYVNDKFIEEQTTKENINSERECVGGSSSVYSLLNPNIQAGVDEAINPQLYNRGIVRVCSTSNPGQVTDPNWENRNESRWRQVGICDSAQMGCWIDTESVKNVVKSTAIEGAILDEVTGGYIEGLSQGSYLDDGDGGKFDNLLEELDKLDADKIILKVDSSLPNVLFNNNKAELLTRRARAYGELAKVVRAIIAIGEIERAKNEVKKLIDKGDTNIDGGSDDSDVDEGFIQISSSNNYPLFELKDGKATVTNLHYSYLDNKGWYWSKDLVGKVTDWTSVDSLKSTGVTEDNSEFILSLKGKSYSEGLKLLMSKTFSLGGALVTTNEDVVKFDKNEVFKVDLSGATTPLYFLFQGGSWVWSPDKDTWMSSDTIIIAGKYAGKNLVDDNAKLINSLVGADFSAGSVLIFSMSTGESSVGEVSRAAGEEITLDREGKINFACDYFKKEGYEDVHIFGIIGNLLQESGTLNPNEFNSGEGAFGIAQWRDERREGLEEFAKENSKEVNDFELQLMFINYELKEGSALEQRAYAALIKTTSIDDAARVFMDKYERAAPVSLEARQENAHEVDGICFK